MRGTSIPPFVHVERNPIPQQQRAQDFHIWRIQLLQFVECDVIDGRGAPTDAAVAERPVAVEVEFGWCFGMLARHEQKIPHRIDLLSIRLPISTHDFG